MRGPTWRAAAVAVACAGLLVVAVAGWDRQSRDARELLEHGTRVSATVVTAPDPRKGNATIEVTYPAGDTRRAAMIKLSTRQR
ncbi:hypothetical protein [Amycolatopsis thermoflava]|uniref:hypothetical protein n=1 Tax=Amycolatopsis thermoflava TaxID=84480 RepID=UPI003EC0CA07